MRSQVRELINGSEGAGQFTARGGLLDFDLFVRLMRQKARDEDTEGELKDAFRVLDRGGQGWIDTTQMSVSSMLVLRTVCSSFHSLAMKIVRHTLTGVDEPRAPFMMRPRERSQSMKKICTCVWMYSSSA